jgi:hypothetical protein
MAYRQWANWSLFSLDTFDTLEGQYPLEMPTQNLGAHYESAWSMNRNEPITQWIHGTVTTWSFGVTLRAKDSTDDIRSKIKWLTESTVKDDKLGRPPLYVWSWGSIEMTCFITALGGIQWEMMPTKLSPTFEPPRMVKFQITLQKYVPWDLKKTDPNLPPLDTFYVYSKVGQTYEAMAGKRYGQPLWGDLVRRRNPDKAYLQVGDRIALPDSDKLLEEEVEPVSAPLQRTEEGLGARQDMFELRNVSKVSHVF